MRKKRVKINRARKISFHPNGFYLFILLGFSVLYKVHSFGSEKQTARPLCVWCVRLSLQVYDRPSIYFDLFKHLYSSDGIAQWRTIETSLCWCFFPSQNQKLKLVQVDSGQWTTTKRKLFALQIEMSIVYLQCCITFGSQWHTRHRMYNC